jgi:hypothetical protein
VAQHPHAHALLLRSQVAMTMDAVDMAVSDKQYWLLMAVLSENLTV